MNLLLDKQDQGSIEAQEGSFGADAGCFSFNIVGMMYLQDRKWLYGIDTVHGK